MPPQACHPAPPGIPGNNPLLRCLAHALCVVLLVFSQCVSSQTIGELGLKQIQSVFASAEEVLEIDEAFAARPVSRAGTIVGYVFLTNQLEPVPAYSGKPISTLVGIDLDAQITGVSIISHDEPILVVGVTDQDLRNFVSQYIDQSALSKIRVGAHNRPGYIGVDGISGATISVMVLNRSIMYSAKKVAAYYRLPRPVALTENSALSPAVATSAVEEDPQWRQLWEDRQIDLAILMLALLILVLILFFQDWFVVHTKFFHRVRTGYLVFTVVFIGYYCLAQLSIVNVLAFVQMLVHHFTWETLLLDPIIFTLWGFVAVSLILWGRGVYCGWLCPFGALQDLIFKLGEKLGIKSFEFPQMVHERLWAFKYIILLLLVGVSLESLGTAARIAEVEPFKTTITLRLQREWWFVAYALALLVISAFNSKFYCKYLCPLGAGLSLAAQFKVFDWLRRRTDCGHPCQTCAAQCQISAIKPTGEIIDTECHYCLECQVTYWDNHRCPPLVEKRKRQEKREKNAQRIRAKSLD